MAVPLKTMPVPLETMLLQLFMLHFGITTLLPLLQHKDIFYHVVNDKPSLLIMNKIME